MEPNKKIDTGGMEQLSNKARMSLEDYFGQHTIDEKEALKYHCADTPEGLSRALNEQMGGTHSTVQPHPNNL